MIGEEAARNSQSSVYFLILATLHAYGDNIKEALIVTEGQSTLELYVVTFFLCFLFFLSFFFFLIEHTL